MKNGGSSSEMPSEHQNFPNTRLQYCSVDGSRNNKGTGNNNNSLDKSSIRQRSRRSPWLLRSNLSNYARRRRGSSTSLHTVGLNDEEPSAEIVHTSSIHPAFTSKNGAKQSSLIPNNIILKDKKSTHSMVKENENNFTQRGALSTLNSSDLSTESGGDAMSLNRR